MARHSPNRAGVPARRAVFLDRDGVLNVWRADHVTTWAAFQWRVGALELLHTLQALDRLVIVISNQSCIGNGLAREDDVQEIHRRMRGQAALAGANIAGVYYCPHRAEDDCPCRKPRPGLIEQAARDFELDLDLESNVLLGDSLSDVYAGTAAGLRAVLLRDERGESAPAMPEEPAWCPTVDSFSAFLAHVRQHEESAGRCRSPLRTGPNPC